MNLTAGNIQGLRWLERYAREYGSHMQITVRKALTIAGRQLAVALANTTWPMGENGLKKMTASVEGGLQRLYATPSKIYCTLQQEQPELAGAFWATMEGKRRDNRKALKILSYTSFAGVPVASAVDPAIHQAARGGARMHVTARKPRQIVTGKNALKNYTKRVLRRIGASASGWAWVANDLGGGRGIPAFKGIKRHPRRGGTATQTGGNTPTILLHDQVAYVPNNLHPSRIDRALQQAVRKLEQAVKTAEKS